jgi:hypothetical protein
VSRRLRRWPRRHPGQALTLAAATVLALRWAWNEHPAAVTLYATLTAAVALGVWRARCAWAMREGQKTDLYYHHFATGQILYVGITSSYADRCEQHADDSWWWFYVDPSLSRKQTWPNRQAAARAETAAIRSLCPVGNTRDNPAWASQQPERGQLMAHAAASRGYACPPPVLNTPSPPRPFTRRYALRGAR